jgi:nucleoid-associated protein YgaU
MEAAMKNIFLTISATAAMTATLALYSCTTQETVAPKPAPAPAPAAQAEAKAPAEKAPEKAKATKLAGDVGLLDTEKNYLILVTKDGKLVTIDFDAKYQPTQKEYVNAKIADIGLGSSAVVQYTKEGEKNLATNIEYLPAKGE